MAHRGARALGGHAQLRDRSASRPGSESKACVALDAARERLAQQLAAWRERRAIDRNRPRGWILDDARLREIVMQVPRSVRGACAQFPEFPAGVLKHCGDEMLDCVRAAEVARSAPAAQRADAAGSCEDGAGEKARRAQSGDRRGSRPEPRGVGDAARPRAARGRPPDVGSAARLAPRCRRRSHAGRALNSMNGKVASGTCTVSRPLLWSSL